MAAAAAGAGNTRPPSTAAAVGLAVVVVMLMATAATPAEGFISDKTWRAIRRANRDGAPFVGLVVPNAYEMEPVLRSPSFKPSEDAIPILDVQGFLAHWNSVVTSEEHKMRCLRCDPNNLEVLDGLRRKQRMSTQAWCLLVDRDNLRPPFCMVQSLRG